MESTDPEILQAVAIALDHPRTGQEDPIAEDVPQTRVTGHEIEWCSPGGPTLLASSAGLSGAILTMGTKEIIPLHSRGPHRLQQPAQQDAHRYSSGTGIMGETSHSLSRFKTCSTKWNSFVTA